MSKDKLCLIIVWSLSALVATLAFIAWGNDLSWQFGHLNTYLFFPLLGLLAFSVMWSHYVAGTLRELMDVDQTRLTNYYRYTGYAVLTLICLHRGLLIYQLFRDGAGLPPLSYERYVAPGLGWITLLGTASLLIFLAFEFRRIYAKHSWWHFVPEAGDFAMLAIFYHGLRLGSQLRHAGWFVTVWWFYGITLTVIIARSYAKKYANKKARR